MSNERRPPVPSRVDFFQLPWKFANQWHNPVARGRAVAVNLQRDESCEKDPSRPDPQPSTFWRRPQSIRSLDLYAGFARSDLPRLENELCTYLGPKTSYGSNPGFEVICGASKVKVKFGETTSEPFTARIFWALGYHVDPTDHAERLKIGFCVGLVHEGQTAQPFHLPHGGGQRFGRGGAGEEDQRGTCQSEGARHAHPNGAHTPLIPRRRRP